MGFLQKLWKRKSKKKGAAEEHGEQTVVYDRQYVDFQNEEERERYIVNCLEQIGEASKEIELLTGEYNLVTAYLTDAEEIEMLPQEEKEALEEIAGQLANLEEQKQQYLGRKGSIPDERFFRMERQEEEIPDGCEKIREAEEYQKLVKRDLSRLDGEYHAYHYRREELENRAMNMRGMAVICLVAVIICIGMLLVLQFGLGMNTQIGYLLTAAAAAVMIVTVYIKYADGEKELRKVNNAIHKIVQLQNKVKIRYVNNTNLLEYLYLKYGVENGAELEKLWSRYRTEKEEREKFQQAVEDLEYYQKELVKILMRFRIKDPGRWVHQTRAILDNREMVEIRHELIQRRQSLRSQLDYNKEVADMAKQEVKEVVRLYPAYASEISHIVDRYEKNYK